MAHADLFEAVRLEDSRPQLYQYGTKAYWGAKARWYRSREIWWHALLSLGMTEYPAFAEQQAQECHDLGSRAHAQYMRMADEEIIRKLT